MTIKKHNENYSAGDVVGYEGSYTKFYGYKLLQRVYVELLDNYVWLGQYGTVRSGENEFTPDSGGKTITALPISDLRNDYHSTWTKDEEYKKGDILVGDDKGKVMLFVYFSDSHVERLTPRSDLSSLDQFGYSTLSDYSSHFGPLKVHKTQKLSGYGEHKKFSEM